MTLSLPSIPSLFTCLANLPVLVMSRSAKLHALVDGGLANLPLIAYRRLLTYPYHFKVVQPSDIYWKLESLHQYISDIIRSALKVII
jgi:hypothetical protein